MDISKRFNFKKIFVPILFTLIIFFTVNTDFYHFSINYLTAVKITDKIKFFRSFLPILIIFYFIFFFKFKFSYLKKNIFLFLLIYIFFQVVGILTSDENKLHNIYYSYIYLSYILYFIYLGNQDYKIINQLIFLILSFLFLIFLIFFLKSFFIFLTTSYNFYSLYPNLFQADLNPKLIDPNLKIDVLEDGENTGMYFNSIFLDELPPRSSGLSRIALLLSIFLNLLILRIKKITNKIVIIFLIIFLNTSILLTLSRVSIFSLFFFYFLLFIILKKEILRSILFYILFPVIIFLSLLHLKENILNNPHKDKHDEHKISQQMNLKDTFLSSRNFYSSTGRVELWINGFKHTKDKIFFGNGAQADRYVTNSRQSISNALMYSYVTSGFLGFFAFFTFYLSIFFIVYQKIKIFFINKNILTLVKKEFIFLYSLFVLIIILIRSITETSLANIGLDLFIIGVSLVYLTNRNLNLSKPKVTN